MAMPIHKTVDETLYVSAPAKINLHLRVGPPTADGFHPLLSWMVTVGLFDNLEFTRVQGTGITLSCNNPAIPCDASNLVVKTASALLDTTRGAGVSAALHKRIPVGAGLGGGSSDGAFTLMALNQLLELHHTPGQLSALAARFGSDLSFFFHGPSSICTGRGEIVTPTLPPSAGWAVLILPQIHMATPSVYRRFDEMRLGNAQSLEQSPDWRYWATLGAQELLPLLINDLEAPAFSLCPTLDDLRRQAQDMLERTVRMSGSGSTLFTLADTREEAEIFATRLRLKMGIHAEVVEVCPSHRQQ